MKNRSAITIKIFIFIIIFLAGEVKAPAEKYYKWQRFGGKWEIKNSLLMEQQVWAAPWNYYKLLDYNSIISFNKFEKYNSLIFSFSVKKPGIEIKTRDKIPMFMVSFNITSPYKNWNYHMYGIKITGNDDNLNNINLIYSDRIDKTKKYATKNNTFVKVLTSKNVKIEYGKEYKVKIDLIGKNALLTIDGNKILSGQMPESEHGGKIAFSSKNLLLSIRNVTVLNNKEIIFKDDFTQDTIYVPRRRARKVKK
jgi:hypothetical protein